MKQPSEAPSFDQSMRDSYDANGGSRTKDRVSESPTERLLRKSRKFNAVTSFKPGQANKPLSQSSHRQSTDSADLPRGLISGSKIEAAMRNTAPKPKPIIP